MVKEEKALSGRSGNVVRQQLHYSEHSKAAVLKLLGLVLSLSLTLKRVLERSKEVLAPSELVRSSSGLDLPADELPVADGDDDLQPAEGRDGADGGDSVRDRLYTSKLDAQPHTTLETILTEGGAIQVDGSGEAKVLLEDVSDHGKHRNTAVLHLDLTAALELGSVTVSGETQRVPEPHWRKGSELVLEAHLEGGSPRGHTGRGEGGGAEEGGEDGDGLEHGGGRI